MEVEITTTNGAHRVIVSDDEANTFIGSWREANSKIAISGIVPHADANQVELWFDTEAIISIRKMEVKS
jgi:predicted transcriptional regulator